MDRVYLDYNATTPLDPRVLETMVEAFKELPGNPSSLHWFGQRARAALDDARGQVAALIGASPAEIVFTGSGTEADNLALRGSLAAAPPERRKLLFSSVEHHAVIHTSRALAEEGAIAESVRTLASGLVDLEDLERKLDETTALVCLMAANNETGVVQPVAEAARVAHSKGALLLCDGVQAAGKVPIDVQALGADLLALSAHKLYGPKGVGALFVKRGTRLKALLRGGSQERNRRAGTENVAGAAGFGRAAGLAKQELASDSSRIGELRQKLETALLRIPGTRLNGEGPRVPNTCNLSFESVESESLLMALDLAGIAVSTGAACAAGAVEPSHVLRAMGFPAERVQSSLRLSLGRPTTEAEVDRAIAAIGEIVARQRQKAPASARS